MTTILMTGATSGLGLEVARNLAAVGADLVVGARNPEKADDLKAVVPASQLTLLPLDLASLASVRTLAEAVKDHSFDAVALNAGLQFTGPQPLTADGVCNSFATNHLGHFLLAHLLLPQMAQAAWWSPLVRAPITRMKSWPICLAFAAGCFPPLRGWR
ncbi:MAG: SDR family NAD(P)-dependent oxidoreductase [Alphaproteobacteria bacterium]